VTSSFEVNLFDVMAVTRAVLPGSRRGRHVFVGSIAGRVGTSARCSSAPTLAPRGAGWPPTARPW